MRKRGHPRTGTSSRRPVIGVMGGSAATDDVTAMARRLGALIAGRGWILLNGGRDAGVMAASAAGAREAGGLVVGILPDKSMARASPDLDVTVRTGMGDGRNVINVLSSDVLIVCPGKMGTLSELALALKNKRPVIALGWEPGADFARHRRSGMLSTASSPEDAVEQAARALGASDGPLAGGG